MRETRRRWPFILVGLTLLAAALATTLWLRPSSTSPEPDSLTFAPQADTAVDGGAASEQDSSAAVPPAAGAAAPRATGTIPPQVIVTASQEVVVTDVAGAARTLSSAVTAAGGHLADESTNSGGRCAPDLPVEGSACTGQASSTLTYRVPADQVSTVMDAAAGLGQESWRTRNASDVSSQVADVDARVRSAQASLDRLNALMLQAEDLADVVALESQITARQAELESLQAQQRVLHDQTALATVTTSFTTTTAAQEDPTGPAAAVQDGLEALWNALVSALTVIAWLLPFVVFFAVLALPLAWVIKRRRVDAGAAPAQAEVTDEAREPSRLSE